MPITILESTQGTQAPESLLIRVLSERIRDLCLFHDVLRASDGPLPGNRCSYARRCFCGQVPCPSCGRGTARSHLEASRTHVMVLFWGKSCEYSNVLVIPTGINTQTFVFPLSNLPLRYSVSSRPRICLWLYKRTDACTQIILRHPACWCTLKWLSPHWTAPPSRTQHSISDILGHPSGRLWNYACGCQTSLTPRTTPSP